MGYEGQISSLTVAFISITAAISFLLPIVFLIIWKVKKRAKLMPALIGALIFFAFAICFEGFCHQIFIYRESALQQFITGNAVVYILYAGFAAGIFEETGRLFAFKFFMRSSSDRESAVTYGAGHGGIEAIIVVGLTMISNLAVIFTVNSIGAEAYLATFTGDAAVTMQASLYSLYHADSFIFLLSGFERIFAFILQISLSILVFMAVKRKGKFYLYPVAILLHAAVDMFAVTYSVGLINNIFVIEAGICVLTLAVAAFAYRLYRKDKGTEQMSAVSQ